MSDFRSNVEKTSRAIETLKAQREAALRATAKGPPARTSNPFFGVGPITNMTADELERNALRFEFEAWVEANYRKLDDHGRDIGPFTVGELDRSMHRGYPADKIVLDMMREIHRYFGFPKRNRMAVGLGGGHNGLTVALLHLMNPRDGSQGVFVDTPRPESVAAAKAGFFRQSWGAQILELQTLCAGGSADRVHFSEFEGVIPAAKELKAQGVKLFVGVGHETTGGTTYAESDIRNLLEWIDSDPQTHHALIDGTSLLGAMPWREELVQALLEQACFFMPFQKAVGGVPGYFAATFTPQAMALIESNVRHPAWAIPRHLKLAVPKNAQQPLTGEKTTQLGPFYDAERDKMLGGIINTFSNIAFAETTFGILRLQKQVGSVDALNRRSIENRDLIEEWIARQSQPLLQMGVDDKGRRGAAVTLLKVNDPDISDSAQHNRIVAKAKQLLSYEGVTHPNGDHEVGLDVARYVNAFPGTPGDFRAWIGGVRSRADIEALLENIAYAYTRAKIVVLEEELAKAGVSFERGSGVGTGVVAGARVRKDDPARVYKVLVMDPVGLRLGADGRPDVGAVRAHIEGQGGVFHEGGIAGAGALAPGVVHFFYVPDLSREAEILAYTADGQYDAVIAAATFIPAGAVFKEGGVRIGAGTGNMGSRSWGGGSGLGGSAPLMNTPSFNSRVTAQRVFQAVLRCAPDVPRTELHARVVAGRFDTGKDLKDFPTEKIEGKRIAVLGYGNIGREVARMAKAFGMEVVVYARARHREWIESEGFGYAATAVEAARGAAFLSIHTGLGASENGRYVNQGLVGREVFAVVEDGAVVVNYDRGEVIDSGALRDAVASGKVRCVCVDADVFSDGAKVSGPMIPYIGLSKEFPGVFELLPHVAADTDHLSRVEGAKQAVDQILRAIRYREVVNLKGDLPPGYTLAGAHTVSGVGKVSGARLGTVAADKGEVARLRGLSETLAAFWKAVETTEDPARRAELVERYGERLVLESNRYATLVEGLGLRGPFAQDG
jgi:lactate dehydrogenase-like 2-hydroxyacid dehydrogenase/phosphoserine aminotransferase